MPRHSLRNPAPPTLAAHALEEKRRLDHRRSPLEVFSRLTDGGRRSGCLLLETADLEGPEGRRSLVIPEPILRLELRCGHLDLLPLGGRGQSVLAPLGRALAHLYSVDAEPRGLRVGVPAPNFDPALDDRARLLKASPLDILRSVLHAFGSTETTSGVLPLALYGAFNHELVDRFEELPGRAPDPLQEPDLNLVLGLDGLVFDHHEGEVTFVARSLALEGEEGEVESVAARRRLDHYLTCVVPDVAPSPALPAPQVARSGELPFETDMTDEQFLAGVRLFQQHVDRGDIFQGVSSRSLRVKGKACSPLAVYGRLRIRNPSPYMFFFELGDGVLLGASPETSVRVEDGKVMLSPIAGTVPRGFDSDGSIDADRDARLAVSLLLDEKEQAEHAMLIDLARHDVARIGVSGTREVESPFSIQKFSHVQHLGTRVTAELHPDLDALDAYRACANMGTLTGAPKLRAMELIREAEPTARGFYGGALGYVTREGAMDTCIVIRSLRWKEGTYVVRSGAGIVRDSRPERELMETLHKARAPLQAVAEAEFIEQSHAPEPGEVLEP